MKISALLLFIALFAIACNEVKKDPTAEILTSMEQRLNASESNMQEGLVLFKGQGEKQTLSITFINTKNVDLMDRALKNEMREMSQQLKNTIEGSERIEKYQIRLQKDPNDPTPSQSGFNIAEKGFTFNREDLQ